MVVGFILDRVGSLTRKYRSYGSFGLTGSFEFVWVHSGWPRCRRVHSGWLEFTRARLAIIWFILARVGSLVRS